MAVELIGAKMMAPYYGSSLYVWATVLAITLFALTTGYFIGGLLSEKNNPEQRLYYIALIGAIFMLLMPWLSQVLFSLFGSWRLIPATLLTAGFLLFPPVFLMGMVSPLIITILGPFFNKPGRIAGLVYAVSTLGGIISTFASGFFLIPHYGLKLPCIAFGIFLSIIPLLQLIKKKSSNAFAFLIFIGVYAAMQLQSKPINTGSLKIVSMQEGVLGQLMVLDYLPNKDTAQWQGRVLAVNRIIQTAEDNRSTHYKYLEYIAEIEKVIDSLKITKGRTTVNGLGGGSLSKLLNNKGFIVKAVELDERMVEASINYFNLPKQITTIVDDARHYLNLETEKQDLVVFDMFKGEENPGHVLTLESFGKLKSILSDNGIFIINTHGYLSGENGRGNWSIIKTMQASGFKPFILPVEKNAKAEDFRNILIIGVKNENQYTQLNNNFLKWKINIDSNAINNALLLTDDKPVLDYLNARAARLWRYYYIQNVVKQFNYSGIPIFE